jgi:hypothetical protein
LLFQGFEDCDAVEPNRATVPDGLDFPVVDAPPERAHADAEQSCHLIRFHQSR